MNHQIYLYGMTVWSTIHKLSNEYPAADTYGEIAETFTVPGGETMNAAMLLSALGVRVRIDGPHFGKGSGPGLREFAAKYGIDVSGVTGDANWNGLMDYVLVDGHTRTVFGYFADYFSGKTRRWDAPDPEAVARSKAVGIDPFFQKESIQAAELCEAKGVPYVTIDCPYDSYLHAHSAATVVSREFRESNYPGRGDDELFAEFQKGGRGLTVFTSGKGDIRYGRKESGEKKRTPFLVTVKSTLGAGDTFRAGILFGMYKGWDDDECVRFASGLAGLLCTRMPIAGNTPGLDEVMAFMEKEER
jgi:sugar/nucleoside kinase (ribokinase family)